VLRSHKRLKSRADAAQSLYAACVERAREPVFYARLGVPDTMDGRFDLIALHASVVVEACRRSRLSELNSAFVTFVFAGFEQALRELGVGDFGISHRIKSMADAFYGRLDAYARAFGDEPALQAAILRNVYRGDEREVGAAGTLARYGMSALAAAIAAASREPGGMDFGPLPEV
jgi:cytochrome b pre-mRNA-processing protein 3